MSIASISKSSASSESAAVTMPPVYKKMIPRREFAAAAPKTPDVDIVGPRSPPLESSNQDSGLDEKTSEGHLTPSKRASFELVPLFGPQKKRRRSSSSSHDYRDGTSPAPTSTTNTATVNQHGRSPTPSPPSTRHYYRDHEKILREIWAPGDSCGPTFPSAVHPHATTPQSLTAHYRFYQSSTPLHKRDHPSSPPKHVMLDDQAVHHILSSGLYTNRDRALFWPLDFGSRGRVLAKRPHRGRPAWRAAEAARSGRVPEPEAVYAVDLRSGVGGVRYALTGEPGGYTAVVFEDEQADVEDETEIGASKRMSESGGSAASVMVCGKGSVDGSTCGVDRSISLPSSAWSFGSGPSIVRETSRNGDLSLASEHETGGASKEIALPNTWQEAYIMLAKQIIELKKEVARLQKVV